MSTTVGAVETRSREAINDTYSAAYRWAVSTVLRFVWEGVRKLYSVRPESRYVGLTLTSYELPSIPDGATAEAIVIYRAEILPVDDRWVDALVEYVCHKCFKVDESDVQNASRAAEHLSNFMNWSAQ